MPLPQGKLMASQETQQNVNSRMNQAMEDLALKAERQQQAKENKRLIKEEENRQAKEEEELELLRKSRLDRMKREKGEEEKNRTKGHGEVSFISEVDFLPTVLGSARVVVHFYSEEFEHCQLVNQNLTLIASKHLEAKFVKILASKAPFFVERFAITTLPCLVVFEDGKAVGKKVGFRGEDSIADLERYLVDCGVLSGILASASKQVQVEVEEEEEW